MRTKRILSVLLALVMTLGLIPFSAFTAFADDTPEATEISVGETLTASVGKGETVYFTFTPDEDGNYLFCSSGEYDTLCYLRDKDFNDLMRDDDSGEDLNFRIGYAMTSGTKYYFAVSQYGAACSFGVTLEKAPKIESMNMMPPKLRGYADPNHYYGLWVEISPENAFENITWTSDDDSVASVDDNGNVRLVGGGDAVVTATSESGATASCGITVLVPEVFALDEVYSLVFEEEGEERRYAFTPVESGKYVFFCEGYDTNYCEIESRLKNLRTGEYVSAYNGKLGGYLEAGETYAVIMRLEWKSYEQNEVACELTGTKATDAESVILSQTSLECILADGERHSIYASLTPDNAFEELTWTSGDDDVATVSGHGSECMITPVGYGETSVTATSESGANASCVIKVVPPTAMELGNEYVSDLTGAYKKYFSFTPSETKGYVFSRADGNDDNGLWLELKDNNGNSLGGTGTERLSAELTAGETYILFVSFNWNGSDDNSFSVKVETAPEAESVTLTTEEWNAYIGLYGAYVVGAVLSPEGSFGAVSWTTSDESVATLEINGLEANVKPVGAGTAVITAELPNGESASCVFTVREPEPITLDDPVEVEMINNRNKCFAFVPEETGDYLFYASDLSNGNVPRIYVIGNGVYEYGKIGENVCVSLKKGERYLADTAYGSYSGEGNGSYKLAVTKAVPATSLRIVPEEGYSGFPGYRTTLKAVFEPWNAKTSYVSWSSDNENAVEVYSGNVELKNVGKATVTALSEDGLSASCVITVKDWPEIKVGETLSAVLNDPEENILFRFIPEKDGRYSFYSTSDHDPYCYVLDEYMNEFGFDNDSGERNNFKLAVSLEKGKTYYFKSSAFDGFPNCEFSVTLEEVPTVSSIEIVTLPDRTEFVKGFAGDYYINSGLSLKLYWSDGEVTEWDNSKDRYVRNEHLTFDLSSIDEDGTVKILCGGAQTSFTVTLTENPVESIEVVTPPSGHLVENLGGFWNSSYNENTGMEEEYYFYYLDSEMLKTAEIKINYKNGTSKTVNFGSEIDGYRFRIDHNQGKTHWKVGGENYFTVEFLGATAQTSITVIPNPVDRLELISAPTKEYVYGDYECGYTDSNGVYLFYPYDFTGLAVRVYLTNGETKTIEGIRGDYGEYEGFEYYINYDADKAQVGDFPVTFNYMNKTVGFTLKLKESPLSSIEVTKLPDKTVVYPDFTPDWTGLEITLHNKNGTDEVIKLDQSNCDFSVFRYNGNTGYIEYYYTQNKYFVHYLDAECPVDGLTFAENKEVTGVRVRCFRPDSTSTLIYVTYSDGTEDVFEIDILNGKYEARGTFGYYVDFLTEKGWTYLTFYLIPDSDTYNLFVLGFEFEVIPKYGDVNDDGEVTALDIVRLKKYLAAYDFDKGVSDVAVSLGADTNGDGIVSALDLVRLKRYFAEYDASNGVSGVLLGVPDKNDGWSPDIT